MIFGPQKSDRLQTHREEEEKIHFDSVALLHLLINDKKSADTENGRLSSGSLFLFDFFGLKAQLSNNCKCPVFS
uniref:Ovule protein n=1 Tax=Steinernema glaseri TaxID=37863 RepID=A0A1I8AAY2_9BILA